MLTDVKAGLYQLRSDRGGGGEGMAVSRAEVTDYVHGATEVHHPVLGGQC